LSKTEFKVIDYAKGDILKTLFPISKENSEEIIFETGTDVTIKAIKKEKIELEFPDGNIQIFDGNQLPFYFTKSSEGKTFTITHKGVGTPPPGVYSLLPKGATWQKNYVWKVHITLEERNDKEIICGICTTELDLDGEKNEAGKYKCISCKDFVIAFICKTGLPYLDEELAKEFIEEHLTDL
jgi:hypothetical protein